MNLLISKGMVKTALGAVGYLLCNGGNSKTPILCFHSSPRSSDEFLEVLPLLAASERQVIALDSPGYGISENPSRSCSVDDIADSLLEVAEALGIDGKFVVVGNLMGNFHAVSLASRKSERVSACILANIFYYDKPKAEKQKIDTDAPIPDSFELKEDGSHLSDLHNKRKWLDPELNLRVVQSELNYLVNRRARYAKGISIQDLSTIDFETPAQTTKCPTLCIKGEACLEFFDMIGMGGTKQFGNGSNFFPNREIKSLSGPKSTLNMINQMPEEFSTMCKDFLESNEL
ncbi:hypothetical protein ACHAXR_005656 [Thalassiosira sp. AJA248-18]